MENREGEKENESELSKQQIIMQMIILYIAVQNLNSYFILKLKPTGKQLFYSRNSQQQSPSQYSSAEIYHILIEPWGEEKYHLFPPPPPISPTHTII